jgi:hypothetical protein
MEKRLTSPGMYSLLLPPVFIVRRPSSSPFNTWPAPTRIMYGWPFSSELQNVQGLDYRILLKAVTTRKKGYFNVYDDRF